MNLSALGRRAPRLKLVNEQGQTVNKFSAQNCASGWVWFAYEQEAEITQKK